MIYIINTISIILYGLILKPDRKIRYKKLYCILVGVQLILFSGLRYGVGDDYFTYLKIYEDIGGMKLSEYSTNLYWKEPIFFMYTRIMRLLFKDNYIPFFCGMAFVTIYFFLKAAYQRNESIVWNVYIYLSTCLFYISMNQIRQLMAISIVLYSIQFIEEKKLNKYVIHILVASGIHNSALIMLPFYFMNQMKVKSKKTIISCIFLGIVAVWLLKDEIIIFLSIYTKYGYLLQYQAGEVKNAIINFVYRGGLFLGCINYYKQVVKEKSKYRVMYILAAFGIICQFISIFATSMARINTYFYAIFIFLIPVVLDCIRGKNQKLLAKMVIALGMLCYHIFYFSRLTNMDYITVFQVW